MHTPSELASQVRAVLPPGLLLAAPAAWAVLTLGVAFLTCRVSEWFALRPLRRLDGAHWTERARVLAPVRQFTLRGILLWSLMPAVVSVLLYGPLTPIGPRTIALLTGLAGLVGATLGLGRAEGEVYGARRTRRVAWSTLAVTYLLFLPNLVLAALAVPFMPGELGAGAAVVIGLELLVVTWILRGGTVSLLSGLGVARPASAELERVVHDLAGDLGMPAPRILELNVQYANAAALPMADALFVTRPLLEVCSPDQVRAILAHEFGHLTEGGRLRAVRFAAVVALPLVPVAIPVAGTFGPLPALVCALALLLVPRLALAAFRGAEVRADRSGVEHQGDPGTYARALESLARHNLQPAVVRQRGSLHPSLYDRMEAAGITPDYPRPAPPGRQSPRLVVLQLLALFTLLCAGGLTALFLELDEGSLASVAVTGGEPGTLLGHADRRSLEGDQEAARLLREYAVLCSGSE